MSPFMRQHLEHPREHSVAYIALCLDSVTRYIATRWIDEPDRWRPLVERYHSGETSARDELLTLHETLSAVADGGY